MSSEYEEWQRVLSDAFLFPHEGPTVFFLDDSEITRLLPESADAGRHLAAAVRSRVNLAEGRSMFRSITAAYRRWELGSRAEPPPVLPVVAITVLAATRMRSNSEARSTNYYLRLAQALLPDAAQQEVEALRNDLREGGAFLDAVEIWRGLHSWLEAQGGSVGVSTIRDHPHLPRIGYPLSQALVRQSDRLALTRLFQALDFRPDSTPDGGVILGALDIWTSALQNRLSDGFMRALGDTDIRPLLAAVVEAHAQAWDGRVLTNDGKQRIPMHLGIDLDAWEARWIFVVPADGPDALTVFDTNSGQEVELTASPDLARYDASISPAVSPDLLLSGVRLNGMAYTADFPPAPVIFLLPDPYTGAWSSVAGMLPFEEHVVAISAIYAEEFQHLLREAAAVGWRLIPQRGSMLIPNYALFQNVRFTDAQALELVLSRLPRLRGIGVAPAVIPRARFVRGLPIATTISATHYLVGGEPDLLLPSGPDPRDAIVTLDGRQEILRANGFPLELRRFVSGTGRHVVDADGQEIAFTTLEGGPDPSAPVGTAALGWTSELQMGGTGQPLAVVGALAADLNRVTAVLARRGRDESWLLHRDGYAERITESAPPSFLSSIDIDIHPPSFEISAHDSAQWLAQRRGARWHLTEIGPPDPKEHTLDIDVLSAWKRACMDTNGAQLWNLQLSMSVGPS